MSAADLKKKQKAERRACLDGILASKAPRKLIAAGPGTGKTYTFRELLARRAKEKNLAVTFINKLANEMKLALSTTAEVKTFHAYCKKILHEQNGAVEVAPFLPDIIQTDADLLENGLENFVQAMQSLAKKPKTIGFYLRRGDYYDAVGFDDAIYRLLQHVEKDADILPALGQIVVDEYQDFNALEVEFLHNLAKKGDILIVGDDDQAVYPDRCASPDYLRQLYGSGEYEVFSLPFCGRCTSVVVEATNAVIKRATKRGHFKNRIPKPYECFMDSKEADSIRNPRIHTARCSTITVVPKYIKKAIEAIPQEDVAESRDDKDGYPTVLVIGPKHYLAEIAKQLTPHFPQLEYVPTKDTAVGLTDAYEWLLRNDNSNLGWRIVLELYANKKTLAEAVAASEDGTPMKELLNKDLVKQHRRALKLVSRVQAGESLDKTAKSELKELLNGAASEVLEYFKPKEQPKPEALDKSRPTIKLTTFVGCKGLSAGHVFIVGANAGSIPKDPNDIQDREVSQFIVALTRTRKRCHILSNRYMYGPKDKKGNFLAPLDSSPLTQWIPSDLKDDHGDLKAADIK